MKKTRLEDMSNPALAVADVDVAMGIRGAGAADVVLLVDLFDCTASLHQFWETGVSLLHCKGDQLSFVMALVLHWKN